MIFSPFFLLSFFFALEIGDRIIDATSHLTSHHGRRVEFRLSLSTTWREWPTQRAHFQYRFSGLIGPRVPFYVPFLPPPCPCRSLASSGCFRQYHIRLPPWPSSETFSWGFLSHVIPGGELKQRGIYAGTFSFTAPLPPIPCYSRAASAALLICNSFFFSFFSLDREVTDQENDEENTRIVFFLWR